MKTPQVLTIETLMSLPDEAARPMIDVRTPPEYAEDHLPGAANHPVLGTDERALIGTVNRQAGAFEANRRGAALVSANIAAMLAGPFADRPRDWSPVIYCWRGGSRSWSLATVLSRIGWRIGLLDGGYRRYRQYAVAEIDRLTEALDFIVLAGPTGSGKTRMLGHLSRLGLQTLDLEALAAHRGSVLGSLPGEPQPSQKAFDSHLWRALRSLDPDRPVLVESESRKIGQLHLPERLILRMRAADCIAIEMPIDARVPLLRADYPHLEQQGSTLVAQLNRLVPLHQDRRVAEWRSLAEAARWEEFVARLLTEHYDPAYRRSMTRNYRGIERAPQFGIAGPGDDAFAATAQQIVAWIRAREACARSRSAA